MKIACERCNKVMDVYFRDRYEIAIKFYSMRGRDRYEKIRMKDEDKVLCKDCYEKLSSWMYELEEAAEKIE